MARRIALYITYGNDESCLELRRFIEETGITLELRDISKEPLTADELNLLIGSMDVRHFLNPVSDSYDKHKLSENSKPREEILQLMADDHTLIRRPIIRTKRLTTIGCNKKTVSQILQVPKDNGKPADAGNRSHSRGKGGRSQRSAAAASR